MGICSGKPSTPTTATNPNEFTLDEREALRTSWEIIQKDIDCFGLAVFTIVLRNKEIVELFQLTGAPLEKIRDKQFILDHGNRFVLALSPVFDNLDDFEKADGVMEAFAALGRRHIGIGGHFKKYYFHYFNTGFQEALHGVMGSAYTKEVELAWNKVLKLIQRHMIIGIEQARRNANRNNQISSAPNGSAHTTDDSQRQATTITQQTTADENHTTNGQGPTRAA